MRRGAKQINTSPIAPEEIKGEIAPEAALGEIKSKIVLGEIKSKMARDEIKNEIAPEEIASETNEHGSSNWTAWPSRATGRNLQAFSGAAGPCSNFCRLSGNSHPCHPQSVGCAASIFTARRICACISGTNTAECSTTATASSSSIPKHLPSSARKSNGQSSKVSQNLKREPTLAGTGCRRRRKSRTMEERWEAREWVARVVCALQGWGETRLRAKLGGEPCTCVEEQKTCDCEGSPRPPSHEKART